MRAVLIAALVFVTTDALAYECTFSEDVSSVPLAWNARELVYVVHEGLGVPEADVEAAFEAWSSVACSDLTFRFEGVVTEASEHPIEVRSAETGWSVLGDPDTAGVTVVVYEVLNGRIRQADVYLNREDFMFADTSTGACDPANGIYDHRSVLAHEIGHAVGIAHTTNYSGVDSDPTMAPRVGPCDASKRDLASDDIEALCALYPPRAVGACNGRSVLADKSIETMSDSGCTTAPGRGDFVLLLIGLFGLKTCRKTRSGG